MSCCQVVDIVYLRVIILCHTLWCGSHWRVTCHFQVMRLVAWCTSWGQRSPVSNIKVHNTTRGLVMLEFQSVINVLYMYMHCPLKLKSRTHCIISLYDMSFDNNSDD